MWKNVTLRQSAAPLLTNLPTKLVRIWYVKANGQLRMAIGTTSWDYIPAEFWPQDPPPTPPVREGREIGRAHV